VKPDQWAGLPPVSIAVSLSSLRDFHLHKKRRAWQISGNPKASANKSTALLKSHRVALHALGGSLHDVLYQLSKPNGLLRSGKLPTQEASRSAMLVV
jgi:hypothetical protein